MKYYAKIDANSVVEKVVVAPEVFTEEMKEKARTLFPGTWVETFKDGGLRKNYAGVGYTYDSTRDAFIPPTPYPSWILDEATCQWQAPIPYPTDDNHYRWNESTQAWDTLV
jgi:hypothetical protein